MDERLNPGLPPERPPSAEASRPTDPTGARPSTTSPLDDPRALQILSTEHWSLLASRSLAYNEAFSRAGMFLSFLSATLIVIGFLVGTQGLTSGLVPVVVVLLIADLYIGAATVGRLFDASREELECVRGMNRIRHAYREILPDLEPYFISGFHDDASGLLATYGYVTQPMAPPRVAANIVHGLTTAPGMIAMIDVMILAALCAVVAIGVGATIEVGLLVGVAGFLVGFVIFSIVGMRAAMGTMSRGVSRFPTPDR
ncbi:MAG TPA: hypothetical protein VGO15_00680 [Candidatus Limnocylindrales bacterium]|nr:hypothetical protein [Candidatus Limnocylindrales bacterium]